MSTEIIIPMGRVVLAELQKIYTIDEIKNIAELLQFASRDSPKEVQRQVTINRIVYGIFIEHVTIAILRHCNVIIDKYKNKLEIDIEHIPCKLDGLTWDEKSKEIESNAVNGDMRIRFRFVSGWSPWMNVDIKGGSKIAKKSLDRFRSDGYYLMNAVGASTGLFYYMVQNNSDFQKAVREYELNALVENSDDDGLYDVHFDKTLRPSKNYPNINILKLFDAKAYRMGLRALRDELDIHGIKDIMKHNVA